MAQPDITAVILAGGLATRLGGVDKGLQPLAGQPLAARILERIQPQVKEVLINCNRNSDAYGRFGCRLVPDRISGFPGPLAGLHAAFHAAGTSLVLTVPCDSPFLPADLAGRLHGAMAPGDEAAIAASDRRQPVFALYRADLLPRLEAFLLAGGRKVGEWQKSLIHRTVDFSDQPEAFRNFNAPEDWPSGS